jgi:hypothetical protein
MICLALALLRSFLYLLLLLFFPLLLYYNSLLHDLLRGYRPDAAGGGVCPESNLLDEKIYV